MKRLILASLLICGAAITAQAQKVYKDGSMFVIECAGMPAKVITSEKKALTTNGTNSILGTNDLNNLGSAINNEKVAYKFEVAATDNTVNSQWLSAVNFCTDLSGGNWRMPTQRELMLIWIQHEKLKTLPGFTLFNTSTYWSATEYNSSGSWYINFSNGYTNFYNKTSTSRVRCIRDLTLTTK